MDYLLGRGAITSPRPGPRAQDLRDLRTEPRGEVVLVRDQAPSGLRTDARTVARSQGALHRERDAEVGDERMPAVQQDVLGLDVAVDDAECVCGPKPSATSRAISSASSSRSMR